MDGKRIVLWGGRLAVILLSAILLLGGSLLYTARYKISTIDTSASPDGEYTVLFQQVGEPDWPFGASHGRLVLKDAGRTIQKHRFDAANDGASLCPEDWRVRWQEDGVQVILSGEEQNAVLFTLYFDGTSDEKALGAHGVSFADLDPAEDSPDQPWVDLSAAARENGRGEHVFALSAEAFVAAYNRVYQQDQAAAYLTPPDSENWDRFNELTPCFGYPAVRQKFSENKAIWPMPTVSIYTSDRNEIYEIRTTFDDHSYQEALFDKFEVITLCLLRTACPELSDEEAAALFNDLCGSAEDNFWGDHHTYDDPERPPLTAVYQYGNVGFYCFYGSGNIEICMIPLTAAAVEALPGEGTVILGVPSAG